ncbi:hypothetical protein [Gymnodinialimonas hymeniacidonis]|uniref:hypothetical protein n=1 Tax=Gymnodinialimonas hymeniacidonis TaxID=3126508 RepID=UPI0034C66C32
MKTEQKTMTEKLTDAVKWVAKTVQSIAKACVCHRSLYGQLSGCHGFAAWATGKPEIYVPMAVLYAVMAFSQH